MRYQVAYLNQNWIASRIEAESPLAAARQYVEEDTGQARHKYSVVIVCWGMLGWHRQSFNIQDLLPAGPPVGNAAAEIEKGPVLETASPSGPPSHSDGSVVWWRKFWKPLAALLVAAVMFGLAHHVRYHGEGVTMTTNRSTRTLSLDDTVAFFSQLNDRRWYDKASADLKKRKLASRLLVVAGVASTGLAIWFLWRVRRKYRCGPETTSVPPAVT